ncbi:MAG: hypothetical protein ACSLEN_11005 [Candidatus Malihini olakiniferum]
MTEIFLPDIDGNKRCYRLLAQREVPATNLLMLSTEFNLRQGSIHS